MRADTMCSTRSSESEVGTPNTMIVSNGCFTPNDRNVLLLCLSSRCRWRYQKVSRREPTTADISSTMMPVVLLPLGVSLAALRAVAGVSLLLLCAVFSALLLLLLLLLFLFLSLSLSLDEEIPHSRAHNKGRRKIVI